jgi:DNA helicase HerA-like ATPase
MEPEPFAIATATNGSRIVFSREERERHVWIVGKSGSGKSTFLFNLAMGDICAGEGVAIIDPHGDLAEDILDAIPSSRINEVCYLDAGETEYPVGFNPATKIAPARRALAASGIVAAFSISGPTAGGRASNISSITALPRLSRASMPPSSTLRASTPTIVFATASSAASAIPRHSAFG